jgi:hypothetical protein
MILSAPFWIRAVKSEKQVAQMTPEELKGYISSMAARKNRGDYINCRHRIKKAVFNELFLNLLRPRGKFTPNEINEMLEEVDF